MAANGTSNSILAILFKGFTCIIPLVLGFGDGKYKGAVKIMFQKGSDIISLFLFHL